MHIKRAEKMGFCFGVRKIDDKAESALAGLEDGMKLYSYGPLIHNSQYVAKRSAQGIQVIESLDDLSFLDENSIVILRAHGITEHERRLLEATPAKLIDGTCPVLLNIYRLAARKHDEGKRVVIIGDPNHPEVYAMKSYLGEDAVVIETEAGAAAFRSEKPLFVISQTTNRYEKFERLAGMIAENNDAELRATICNATAERQDAVKKLANEVDAFVVVGGKHSSNTQKLAQVAERCGKNVYKAEVFSDLPLQELSKYNTIGITAGASAPDWIIEEVVIGMDNFSNEEFMEQIEGSMVKIYPKDIVKGTVISVKDDEVYVDIRYRSDGIIKTDEMSDEERDNTREVFHEGEEIDVYVIKLDDGEGNVVLSTRRVEGLKNWQKLVDKFDADEIVEAKVTGDNTGGLVVSVMGINGFIPASQITTYFIKNFKQFVGQTLECKIVSIDERKRRVVLSSRAVKEQQLDRVWEGIVVGEKVKGKVVRMTDFGAFVDLGGVDGLIHVSDISWERIGKPSDVLEIGQEIEPIVLKANRDRNRISLGLKQLMPKPFEAFLANNKAGDVVKGTVVNLLDFGAFIRLSEGVEGLVHVSQIANQHIEKPADALTVGQEVEVKILDIEEDRQRIALSIRALQEPKEEAGAQPKKFDESKFERKPRQERKAPVQREKKQQAMINFDSDSDIGTNLGDLIAAQMGLVSEDAEASDEAE